MLQQGFIPEVKEAVQKAKEILQTGTNDNDG